ncbi:efflux RND transporter permease subunit [Gloeobacter kilaueensis]|uniref:Heavy metal efflux pump, CzcA family n=1 Tax=Gloeobacter kilaueensis (strain ATCC BAA-2537 / CCAP 1431/1 / ULC 316 / JS1) TaxID=1183438 RepID=U5QG01_GLOK1|nr:CusA/CzcA family heavy metal efflux RND transporter [Gloeobacter kilaueensis]AGY56605.1 heavy metal efflux pump, CzcA family [Gloeobacter kilaueensis JS1]
MKSPIDQLIAGALRSRYLTLAIAAAVLAIGVVAWRLLPLEAYPELADPQVRVITLYPGKGAEEVERLVTVPLEKELNGIPNQTALRSISLYGLSVVTTVFKDGTPTNVVRQQVLERIAGADLPDDARPGLEADVGSLREIYRYTLQSRYYTPMGLRAIQEWELEKAFRQVPGVIDVVSQGGPTRTYQVNVDPERLRARNLTLQQLYDALAAANATTGGGFIEKNGQAFIVRGLGLLRGTADIGEVVIATQAGTPVRVRDVATVTIGPRPRRGQVGLGTSDDTVEGIVLLRRGENPTRVLENLYARLPEIRSRLPGGVQLVPLYDRSTLINRTLTTVGENVATGIGLVLAVLAIFLFDLRSALIAACVIPISLLFAFIGLNLFGVPANLLSLGAIDFGILVDGAVIMTENIVRKLSEEGKGFDVAGRLALLTRAATEVGRPVLFGIGVIIVTFLPIFTFAGVEGKLFRPLATTMVSALVGAGLAALTVIPVLCSFFLVQKPLSERESPVVSFIRRLYTPALSGALAAPWLVLAAAATAFVVAVSLFLNLGSEFLPHLEEGNIWLRATLKPGSITLEQSVKVAREVRLILSKYPEVISALSQEGGPDDGTDPARFADHEYLIDLKPSREWRSQFHRNKDELITAMRRELETIPGANYYFTQYIQTTLDEALSGVQGSLVAKIAGPDLAKLEQLAGRVGQIMNQTPGIVDVIVDPLLGQPQFAIAIDRAQAARYGLNVEDLRKLVEIAVAGKAATEVIEGERRFDLVVRLSAPFRSSEQALGRVLIDTPGGAKIPLSQVASLREVNGATQIWREAGYRLATIRANVRGRDLATAVADAQRRVESTVTFPEGYRIIWSGEFQRQRDASAQLAVVLPLTMAVILSVLWFAFRRVRSALVVFAVVPLASIGGVLALWLSGTYFSISAGVGFIALFGIAVQDGILLVTFINKLLAAGLERKKAVYEGALLRLRPVLITATVASLGLVPAATSNEIGAQTQRPFALVIIGGLVTATITTLFVLPALYRLFAPQTLPQPAGRPRSAVEVASE